MYLQKTASGESLVPNIIDDTPVSLPESQNFPVINGSSGRTIHYAQSATPELAIQAIESSVKAFKSWKNTSVSQRAAILNKAASILLTKVSALAEREVPETSCDDPWPGFECMFASKFVASTAGSLAREVEGRIVGDREDAEGSTSLVFREPVGVVLCIIPWNAPIILGCRGIASALAAGCTVVFKASELCPWTHQLIVEVFAEAGLPPGCLNKIQCSRKDGPAVTEAIISHPSLRKVEFIGSAAIGRVIGQVAGKYLKPVLMELGDQSPVIVLEDADLEVAAKNVVQATLAHHGQICFGTERIIVHESIAQTFTTVLLEAFKNVPTAGNAVTLEAAQRAQAIISEAVSQGAKFISPSDTSNTFTSRTSLTPSLLTDVPASSRLAKEESFAPSASLYTVKSDDEAIAMANDTSYGLSASVFTRDVGKGLKMARELEFGQVQVNAHTMFVNVGAPQTGFKGSGWGSNGAGWGIGEFLFDKHVSFRS